MNQLDDAQRHFMAALALDATNFAALYNLALIDERAARPESALAWLAKAEVAQHQSTRLLLTKSRIARSIGNHQVADELLSRVITADPTEPEGWVLRGLARLAQSPADAAADFAKAQAWSTTRFIAGQNRAHVLSEYLKRPAEAIEVLSELLTEDPEFLPGLSGRAVLYAREGRKEEALADAKRCTELAMTPQLHYQLACVYALLAEADESLKNRALHHLALATFPAYGADVIGSDEDLRNLRDASEFKAILHGIQVGVELKAPHDK
jgi:tetratricopeptide (TPR) repeat protein